MDIINVAIIEDDKFIGNAVVSFLSAQKNISVIGHHSSLEELQSSFHQYTSAPHVVILDIVLPGVTGISGIKTIKERWPDSDIIMFSVMDDGESIYQSLCEGAIGYITKELSMPEMLNAVEDVAAGKGIMSPSIARKVAEHFHVKKKQEEGLTPREMDIVHGITEGLSYKLIAVKLNISIDTVRKHIKSIYRKLQINSKAQLISRYYTKA